MMLSKPVIRDRIFAGDIHICPAPSPEAIRPVGVDLRLGMWFKSPYEDEAFLNTKGYTLIPGECVLAQTAEKVRVSSDLAAWVTGNVHDSHPFLSVSCPQGFIHSGHRGPLLLELKNLADTNLCLTIGAPIAQLNFFLTV